MRAQPSAGAGFDSSQVETGEPFSLRLLVSGAAEKPDSVDFSAWESLLPPQNVLQESGWKVASDMWADTFTLIAFDSMSVELPPLTIRLRNGDTVQTNPLQLTVTPTLAPDDLNSMADIKDIRREPFQWIDLLPWALVLGALFGLAALWYWISLMRQKRKKMRSQSIQLPAHELALRKIQALEQQQHWQNGRFKAYYDELSFILREYLQRRYGIQALESATDEIFPQLRKTDFPDGFYNDLRDLLRWADLAKFAKAVPPPAFHEKALENARLFVHETRLLPVNT